MNISHEGARRRYYHERAKVESQVGDPVRADVSLEARQRLMREVLAFANSGFVGLDFKTEIEEEAERVLGGEFSDPEYRVKYLALDEFLSLLEICTNVVWSQRREVEHILALQSILADDLSAYRLRNVGTNINADWQVQPIDVEHLHKEIVDRTFELTRNEDFVSAQRDYAEAWKHYAKGDLDDAVVNAHKAVESASKVIIKRLDPASTPEQKQMNQLVPELVRLDVLPSKIQNMVTGLNHIFMSSGSLRNAPGIGHGSVDLQSPEATIALLALRMSGTLVNFIAERWQQMKPPTIKKTKKKS